MPGLFASTSTSAGDGPSADDLRVPDDLRPRLECHIGLTEEICGQLNRYADDMVFLAPQGDLVIDVESDGDNNNVEPDSGAIVAEIDEILAEGESNEGDAAINNSKGNHRNGYPHHSKFSYHRHGIQLRRHPEGEKGEEPSDADCESEDTLTQVQASDIKYRICNTSIPNPTHPQTLPPFLSSIPTFYVMNQFNCVIYLNILLCLSIYVSPAPAQHATRAQGLGTCPTISGPMVAQS